MVIVGGGFGGLACARALDGADVDVLLLDARNYHLFTPLLYQVATALLDPSDIAYPFRTVFRRSRNVRFRQARVTGVDFDARTAHRGRRRHDRLRHAGAGDGQRQRLLRKPRAGRADHRDEGARRGDAAPQPRPVVPGAGGPDHRPRPSGPSGSRS